MNTSKLKLVALAIASMAAILTTGSTQAGLTSSLVSVSAYYPDSSTVFEPGPNTTVSGAIEYPAGSFSSYNPVWAIDITDTQIRITDTGAANSYTSASFNGWVLTIVSGPVMSSAVVDGASQFNPVGISILSGNQLFLNYSGITAPAGGTSVIDIITTVPEPSTFAIAGASLVVGIASKLRRRGK